MSAFLDALRSLPEPPPPSRWAYLPYDQLNRAFIPPGDVGVVLVENPYKAARRPYHQQKLALILANQRHFALELRAAGIAVCVVIAGDADRSLSRRPHELLHVRVDPRTPTHDALAAAAARLGPLALCEPAEYELRAELAPLLADGRLVRRPHPGWLTTDQDFTLAAGAAGTPAQVASGSVWRMDAFYRVVRRRSGVLMEPGARGKDPRPVGGKFSFDAENRQPWRGEPPIPTPPVFTPDAVTREVGDLVARRFGHHPGRLDLSTLPATLADAERLWAFGLTACLPHFGPYEDAIHACTDRCGHTHHDGLRHASGLFHTRLSAVLNLHRLMPARVLDDVLSPSHALPLQSQEGFVRQILGWREFVRHVHRRTRGFRDVAPETPHAWRGPWPTGWTPGTAGQGWGGADPSVLGAHQPLPPAFWGAPSGLACLDTVVADVWREGWSHHITRLMVLSNLATLLDVSPRALTDWFWVAYVDAFDWVVEPNVLAMGTYGVGDLMTTKPYVAGAAYLSRMGDACRGCAFDPKTTCPITPLYWDFLARHRDALARNPRLQIPLASSAARPADRRANDHATFTAVSRALTAGERLTPQRLAPAPPKSAS